MKLAGITLMRSVVEHIVLERKLQQYYIVTNRKLFCLVRCFWFKC